MKKIKELIDMLEKESEKFLNSYNVVEKSDLKKKYNHLESLVETIKKHDFIMLGSKSKITLYEVISYVSTVIAIDDDSSILIFKNDIAETTLLFKFIDLFKKEVFNNLNIYINNDKYLSNRDIQEICKKLKKSDNGLDIIFVDPHMIKYDKDFAFKLLELKRLTDMYNIKVVVMSEFKEENLIINEDQVMCITET